MLLIYFCALASIACAVSARRFTFDDKNMPVRLVETSYGQSNHERVDYLEAVIQPHHVNSEGRLNFSTTGSLNDYFVQARAPGDKRGHLVAAQFSGPAEWYNLSPQNPHVNRNHDFLAITIDWYKAECKVRTFLNHGENRYVNWNVRMQYVRDSNRPHEYHLTVNFFVNGQELYPATDVRSPNPFLSEDSTSWVCKACGMSICTSLLLLSD